MKAWGSLQKETDVLNFPTSLYHVETKIIDVAQISFIILIFNIISCIYSSQIHI